MYPKQNIKMLTEFEHLPTTITLSIAWRTFPEWAAISYLADRYGKFLNVNFSGVKTSVPILVYVETQYTVQSWRASSTYVLTASISGSQPNCQPASRPSSVVVKARLLEWPEATRIRVRTGTKSTCLVSLSFLSSSFSFTWVPSETIRDSNA